MLFSSPTVITLFHVVSAASIPVRLPTSYRAFSKRVRPFLEVEEVGDGTGEAREYVEAVQSVAFSEGYRSLARAINVHGA